MTPGVGEQVGQCLSDQLGVDRHRHRTGHVDHRGVVGTAHRVPVGLNTDQVDQVDLLALRTQARVVTCESEQVVDDAPGPAGGA